MSVITDTDLDIIFRNARTHRTWTSEPVSDELLHTIFDTAKLGPTSANSSPLRVVFVRSPEAKERLKPCLDAGNVEKVMTAPVTAIIAYDVDFHKQMHKLNPGFKDGFNDYDEAARDAHASMNAALQGAYMIIAARAFGVDCGPLGGFDRAKTNDAFFKGTSYRSLFVLNLGHGDASKLRPRLERLAFEDAATIV